MLLHPAIPKIRKRLYRALALVDWIFPWRHQTIVLAYHGIGRDSWRFSVQFDDFCAQIEYLITEGFRPVTLETVHTAIEKGKRIPGKSFAVTFDDGYQDILLVKHFLRKRGVQPTVFILAEPMMADREELGTNRRFLLDHELIELSAAGWEIGCHSATHTDFSQLDAEELEREVVAAKSLLEARLGTAVRYFAYPKGFHNASIRAAVQKTGYRAAFSMDDGFIGRATDLYALPRVGVDRTHTLDEFRTIFLHSVIAFRMAVKALLRSAQILSRFLHELDGFEKRKIETNRPV